MFGAVFSGTMLFSHDTTTLRSPAFVLDDKRCLAFSAQILALLFEIKVEIYTKEECRNISFVNKTLDAY